MSTVSSRLLNVAIIHNELACEDESATDAEATEKILYYHPESDDSRARLNHLSLCEGLIAFARTMNPHAPVETVHMQRRRFVFEEVEPSVWCIAVFADEKTKWGMLDDASAHSLVQQVYEALSLFVGPLRAIFHAPVALEAKAGDTVASDPSLNGSADSLVGKAVPGLAFVLQLQGKRKKLRKLQALPEDHYRDMSPAEAQAAQARDVTTSRELEADIARMIAASPAEALRRQLSVLLGHTLLPSLSPLLSAPLAPFGADFAGSPLLAVDGLTFLAAREVATVLGFGDARLPRRSLSDKTTMVAGNEEGSESPSSNNVAYSLPPSRALPRTNSLSPEVVGVCVLVDGQVVCSDFPHAHAKLLLRNHLKHCYEPALRAQAAATSAAAATAASGKDEIDFNNSSGISSSSSARAVRAGGDSNVSSNSIRGGSSRWSTAAIGSALRATVSASSRASEAQPSSSPISPKASGGAVKGLSPSAGGCNGSGGSGTSSGGFLSGGQALVDFGIGARSSANSTTAIGSNNGSETSASDSDSGPWIAVGGGRRLWAPRIFVPCKSAPSPPSARSQAAERKELETAPVWAASGQKTLWRSIGRMEFNRRVASASAGEAQAAGALVVEAESASKGEDPEGLHEVGTEEDDDTDDDDDWLASGTLGAVLADDKAPLAPGAYLGRALCYAQGRCTLLLLADPAIEARCQGKPSALPVEMASWGAGVTRAVAPALDKLNHLLGERLREVPVLEVCARFQEDAVSSNFRTTKCLPCTLPSSTGTYIFYTDPSTSCVFNVCTCAGHEVRVLQRINAFSDGNRFEPGCSEYAIIGCPTWRSFYFFFFSRQQQQQQQRWQRFHRGCCQR